MNSIQALLNHLDANREASSLSLAYASLSDDGITEVSKFVRDNPFVKHLDLRGNNIQAKGAGILSNGLKSNRSLRSLNLKWNSIGRDPSGVQALCEVLKYNLTISHVDLRNNRINTVGAKALGDLLTTNTTISHLDLSWNDLGLEGGRALLEGLKLNSCLVDCQLSGSKVGEETLHEVAFLLRRNRSAAADKAGIDDTGTQVAASDTVMSPLAKSASPRSLPMAENAGSPAKQASRANWTAKDSSSLMLRLMMKEREQVLPEDKLFFQQIREHMDKLLQESSKHKQGRQDGEEREKLASAGFLEREQRCLEEISQAEEQLQRSASEKAELQKGLALKAAELKVLQEGSAAALQRSLALQAKVASEERELRRELGDLEEDRRDLQERLALSSKDLELLEQENEQLREHVKGFQRDVKTILG